MDSSFLIQNVRIFDGIHVLLQGDVWVEDGKIKAVDCQIDPAPGIKTIHGAGNTLLPGLIDAHTHVFFKEELRTALVFGVTTELDMFTDYRLARGIKQEENSGRVADRADLRTAGTLITVTGGHGTEYGFAIPTIMGPEEAERFVDARIAEGSDYIKIIYEDGRAWGLPLPTISEETLTALIRAAHERGKMAVVHISSLRLAHTAIAAGADGLVHLFEDEPPDPLFASTVASHKAFVIPTLTLLECAAGIPSGGSLAEDARLMPYLAREDQSRLEMTFLSFPGISKFNFAYAQQAVRDLKNAQVPLLAGTDAGNPGTAHGASLHRELELLVQSGLKPTEALAAATSAPARVFGLEDRGRIVEGKRADLLLVRGDPTGDITTSRDIVAIWKAGKEIDRPRLVEDAELEYSRGPAGSESGLVSDFDDGTTRTKFGFGWLASVDTMAGGRSAAEMRVVEGGANQGRGCLLICGQVNPALPRPWAGAMLYPGRTPFLPANLSMKKQIRFWTKGDGGTYRVTMHTWNHGLHRASQMFLAGTQWKEESFSFSQFGTDGHAVLGMYFGAGPTPGKFAFQIDDVRIE